MTNLNIQLGTLSLPSPVLTGAGPNVRDHKIINKAQDCGVGGIVSKTFSLEAAKYPKPAIAKTIGNGLLNCETWSDKSMEECIDDYKKIKRGDSPFIVSIGYSAEDMEKLGPLVERELKPDAIEFSTHYQDQKVEELADVAKALRKSVSIPIWMKISPNHPFLNELIAQSEDVVDAYVAINSLGPALDFDINSKKAMLGSPEGYGWLSGPPILPIALQTVHRIRQLTDKPIIGVGGIETGEDALKFIMAGASAVQICSAAIRRGPSVYKAVADEMQWWLEEHGYSHVHDVKDSFGPR
ncbi:MAG: hypothetical protein PQJ50_02170 [Spirochaetales bacterium]|nr:hypothetical protein [Spirochaetales bacterium]